MRIIDFFAIVSSSLVRERSAHESEQLACFFIGLCGGGDRDVHTTQLLDLIVVDLGEDDLFLQAHAVLLQKLDDSAARDDAFRKRILGRYDVLLQNIEEVKHELEKHLFEHPYDWYHLTSLENALRKKAEFVYDGSGYELAVQKIDGMDIADVKRYLKELIEKNMTVGIEIIREN